MFDPATLINTPEGRLFLILLIVVSPKLIEVIRDLVRSRGKDSKQQFDLAKIKEQAEQAADARKDNMTAALVNLSSSLVNNLQKLTDELHESNLQEQDRTKAQERAANTRNEALRDNTKTLADNTLGIATLSDSVEKTALQVEGTIQAAKKAGVDEVSSKIDKVVGENLKNIDDKLGKLERDTTSLTQNVGQVKEAIEQKSIVDPSQLQGIEHTLKTLNDSTEKLNRMMAELVSEVKAIKDKLGHDEAPAIPPTPDAVITPGAS